MIWQFWLLVGMSAAAIAVGYAAIKLAPDIPDSDGSSDWSENAKQEKIWKKKQKDMKKWS